MRPRHGPVERSGRQGMIRSASLVGSVLLACATVPVRGGPARRVPAFPGAEGLGADTPGGRGGRVVAVTTLEDYDPKTEEPVPGSLRAACTMPGRRVVVFRVSGTILLRDKLVITEPFITIAGQSAPGGGICLRRCSMAIGDAEHPVRDVVVRHLRIRPGPDGPQHYSDRDGMPDAWEREHGLDPGDGGDHRGDRDGDGYTNIEEWLNGTVP